MNEMKLYVFLIAFTAIGCNSSGSNLSQLDSMLPPLNVPLDASASAPWIHGLLNSDADTVAVAIRDRIVADSSFDSTSVMASWIAEYQPRQIVFNESTGFVACIKIRDNSVVDRIYVPEPLSDSTIVERTSYFHVDIQAEMAEFFKRFAGVGQEMEGDAGQFTLYDFPSAAEIAYYKPKTLGDWKTSRLLYSAQNGDSVFVNATGATAWRVMETNELVPLFDNLSTFISHFVQLRSSRDDIFDSWSSRKFLSKVENR